MAVYNHTLTPFKMTYLCQTSASRVRWEHGTLLYPCLSTSYNVASINVSEVHLSLWALISVLPQAALLRKPEVQGAFYVTIRVAPQDVGGNPDSINIF